MNEQQIPQKNYKEAPFKTVHRRILIALILGQISCGYALGISGTGFSLAQNYLHLTDFWVGLLGAGSLIGLAGSAVMGKLADSIGRRGLLMINMYIFAALSLVQLLTTSPWLLLLIRIAIGLMIAIDYTVGNSLLVEWLPEQEAGKRQSRLIFYWTIGFVCSYFAGILIQGFGSTTWQIILASSVVPSLIIALYRSICRVPASPSWLASQGQKERAQRLIHKHIGRRFGLPKQLLRRKRDPEKITWRVVFNKQYRRRTIIGGLFYACQAFAFFGISIFLPILLKGLNLGNDHLSGVMYNACVMAGVLVGMALFNRLSRRAFLVGHLLLAALALVIIIVNPAHQPVLQLGCFAIFSVVLSAGLVLDYPYPTELFDIKVRATGVGTVITISRIGAASGTFLLPVLTNIGGSNLAMLVCAIILLIGGVGCLFFAPETSPK